MSGFGTFMVGALLAFAIGTALECYLLLGRVQLLFTYAEQLLVVCKKLLAELPSKSAGRTEADVDQVLVQPWFPRLRLLADLRDLGRDLATRVGVGPGTTVKDALTAESPPDEDLAAPDDDVDFDEEDDHTAEMSLGDELAADVHAHAVRAAQLQRAEPDSVDLQLARFTFAGGHRAHDDTGTSSTTPDSEGDD